MEPRSTEAESHGRKLKRLLVDVLMANKKAVITITIIPGKELGFPVDIDVSDRRKIADLPE